MGYGTEEAEKVEEPVRTRRKQGLSNREGLVYRWTQDTTAACTGAAEGQARWSPIPERGSGHELPSLNQGLSTWQPLTKGKGTQATLKGSPSPPPSSTWPTQNELNVVIFFYLNSLLFIYYGFCVFMSFVCVYACMCILRMCVSCTVSIFCFVSFLFLFSALLCSDCLLFIGLFVLKKERKKVWGWIGGEIERISEETREEKPRSEYSVWEKIHFF